MERSESSFQPFAVSVKLDLRKRAGINCSDRCERFRFYRLTPDPLHMQGGAKG